MYMSDSVYFHLQMSNPWEAELQNMVQMNFGTIPAPNTQEYNGKSHEGFPL